jgi:CheY-like chemotaxis protein
MTDSRPVVLAVDDMPANLDLLHAVLNEDYKVKVATNGPKALELAAAEPRPDIILLDVMMPGMSGHEVCKALKQDPETMPVPVIFITAMTKSEDEQLGLALGAVDYIAKPFNNDIVKARVRAHLENYERTRELIRENRDLRDRKGRSFTEFGSEQILELIKRGEDHSLEFKSTLRWNLHADRSDKKIENSALKTVAGFLNTDGGVLLIGVDDDSGIIGLGNDHFRTEDKLLLHWVNLVKSYLGAEFMPFMRSIITSVGEKRVLVVECLPSTKPVFFTRDNEEWFFARMTNSTQALKASESLAYISEHFTDRDKREKGASEKVASPDRDKQSSNAREDKKTVKDTSLSTWVNELMERHVIRTAVIYFVIAWALTESGSLIADALDAPKWVQRVLAMMFIGGFPAVVLLSWLFDIRIKGASSASNESRKRTLVLVVTLAVLSALMITAYIVFGT